MEIESESCKPREASVDINPCLIASVSSTPKWLPETISFPEKLVNHQFMRIGYG